MPRGDRTGPSGAGTMSGRGMGLCAGNETPGFVNAGPGSRGVGRSRGGRGAGGGRGFRNRFYATGLTGWQRAERGQQAWGGNVPVASPQVAVTLDAEPRITDLRVQADRLERELGGIRDALAQLEAK